MINKILRLARALAHESVKRLPYVAVMLLFLGLFGGYQSYLKTAEGVEIARRNTTAIQTILEHQTTLLEAIQQTSKENKELAAKNQAFIKCIADVFAKYTQDFIPIVIEDLQRCVVRTNALTQTATGSSTSSSQPQSQSTSSPKKSKKKTIHKPGKPNQPEQPPTRLQRVQDVICDLPLIPCEGLPL